MTIINVPKTIFLNLGPDHESITDFTPLRDVSWSDRSIDSGDVEYVLKTKEPVPHCNSNDSKVIDKLNSCHCGMDAYFLDRFTVTCRRCQLTLYDDNMSGKQLIFMWNKLNAVNIERWANATLKRDK